MSRAACTGAEELSVHCGTVGGRLGKKDCLATSYLGGLLHVLKGQRRGSGRNGGFTARLTPRQATEKPAFSVWTGARGPLGHPC